MFKFIIFINVYTIMLLNLDFMSEKIIPVILSGGVGSRLWPLSRASFPKQYLKIGRDNSKTLLQNTFDKN